MRWVHFGCRGVWRTTLIWARRPRFEIGDEYGLVGDPEAALGWISHMLAFETHGLTNVRYRGIIRTSILEGVTAAFVEGFGCRPIAAMRLAPWPASESLQ
jgi:hypothetical protein